MARMDESEWCLEALDALGAAERESLLARHPELRAMEALDAPARDAEGPGPAPMDPLRSARVRKRLLSRARAERPASARRDARHAAGWLVAAGLASLLLTHHTFHQPLSMGWVAASILGIALFLAGLLLVRERRRSESLRRELAGTIAGPGEPGRR